MATLKDVANLANVDVSTVSRALSGKGYVHPATKVKIYDAVKQLSYQPNLLAKGLREGKRHVIGVVVPTISLSVFSEATLGIERKALEMGYETVISHTDNDPDIEAKSLQRLRSSYVDGIIIAPTGQNSRLIRSLHSDGIAIVQLIRKQDESLSSVVADYYRCGYMGACYLMEHGCRHIGFVNGSTEIIPYRDRYRGYHKALKESRLEEYIAEMPLTQPHFQGGFDAAYQLIGKNPEIDGLIAATDMQGLGVLRALKMLGLSVPKQVKVLSLSGHFIGGMLETTMSSIEMPLLEMGRSAAEMLVKMIEDTSGRAAAKLEHVVFQSSITERETV